MRGRMKRTRIGEERLGDAFEDAATYELENFTNKLRSCNTRFIGLLVLHGRLQRYQCTSCRPTADFQTRTHVMCKQIEFDIIIINTLNGGHTIDNSTQKYVHVYQQFSTI